MGEKKFHQTHSFNTPAYIEPESLLKVFVSGQGRNVIRIECLLLIECEQNTFNVALLFLNFKSLQSKSKSSSRSSDRHRGCCGKFFVKVASPENFKDILTSLLCDFDSRKAVEFGTKLILSKCLLNESVKQWLNKSRMLQDHNILKLRESLGIT